MSGAKTFILLSTFVSCAGCSPSAPKPSPKETPAAPARTANEAPAVAKTPTPKQQVTHSSPRLQHREKTMRYFEDISPKGPLDPSKDALAVFSKGFELLGATILLSPQGCTLKIQHHGRRYMRTLKDFRSCRLAERGSEGHADIRSVKGRKGKGLLLVGLRPEPQGDRCITTLMSLRITKMGPRLSSRSGSTRMCGILNFDDIHYEMLSYEDRPMKPLAP